MQLEEVDILGFPVRLGERAPHGIPLRRCNRRADRGKRTRGIDASSKDLHDACEIAKKKPAMYSYSSINMIVIANSIFQRLENNGNGALPAPKATTCVS